MESISAFTFLRETEKYINLGLKKITFLVLFFSYVFHAERVFESQNESMIKPIILRSPVTFYLLLLPCNRQDCLSLSLAWLRRGLANTEAESYPLPGSPALPDSRSPSSFHLMPGFCLNVPRRWGA